MKSTQRTKEIEQGLRQAGISSREMPSDVDKYQRRTLIEAGKSAIAIQRQRAAKARERKKKGKEPSKALMWMLGSHYTDIMG